MAIEKIKISFGATSSTARLNWPILPSFEVELVGLAVLFSTALRVFIFSIVLGAKYSSYVKAIATFALIFLDIYFQS